MASPSTEDAFGGLFAQSAPCDVAVVATDAELRIVSWSAGAERLYGWTAAEVIGKPVSDVLRSELTGRQRGKALSQVSQHGEIRADYVHHHRLGHAIHVLADTLVIPGPSGEITGYISVNRDLSAVRRREQEYHMLRQAMLVGRSFAFQWLPEADEVRRSRECAAILGLEGAVGAFQESSVSYFQRILPDDRPRFVQTVLSLNPENDTYRTRYRVYTGGDEPVYLEESARGEFDENGNLVQLYGMAADVTDAVWGERLLQQTRDDLSRQVTERTRELHEVIESLQAEIRERERAQARAELQTQALRAAANGIVITDPAGRIEWANPAFTQMTGYQASEIMGQNLSMLKSGVHGPEVYRRLWETILEGSVWRGEIVNRRKDGTLYVEEQTITPVHGPDNKPAHFVAIKQDVTARKAAEEELQRRHQELRTLNLIGTALNRSLVLADVLATCRGLLAVKLEGAGGAVYLYDNESRSLKLEAAWGVAAKEQHPHPPDCNAEGADCDPFDDRLHEVWASHEVKVLADRLCVPLLAHGRLYGVLDLLHPFGAATPPLDTSFYEALGREVGAAIENAVLFEEVLAGRQRLQNLSRRLVEIQEAERRHISRELHDEAGQVLMGLRLGLGQLERHAHQPDFVVAHVEELRAMTDGVLETLHALAMDLRPASLEHLGLVQALQQYAESIADKHGLAVEFETMGLTERLPATIENAFYRIVQEAVANVVHHARASRVDILLEQRGTRIVLMIEDDGVGFDPAEAWTGSNGRLGLVGIRERAEMLGGSLVIESVAGTGTTMLVEAPI